MAEILQIVRKPASIVTDIRKIILPLLRPPTEIAMPLKTLAHTLAARESVHVKCSHPMCCRSIQRDKRAQAAGRDRRPGFFTCTPDDEGQQRERNRDWKPTFESAKRST